MVHACAAKIYPLPPSFYLHPTHLPTQAGPLFLLLPAPFLLQSTPATNLLTLLVGGSSVGAHSWLLSMYSSLISHTVVVALPLMYCMLCQWVYFLLDAHSDTFSLLFSTTLFLCVFFLKNFPCKHQSSFKKRIGCSPPHLLKKNKVHFRRGRIQRQGKQQPPRSLAGHDTPSHCMLRRTW